MRDKGVAIVDVKKAPEEDVRRALPQADIATAPLRDCISYYNGHGDAEPGSLAYYGGGRWHKYRDAGAGDARPVHLRQGAPVGDARHRLTHAASGARRTAAVSAAR